MKVNDLSIDYIFENYSDLIWDYDDTLSNTIKKKGRHMHKYLIDLVIRIKIL